VDLNTQTTVAGGAAVADPRGRWLVHLAGQRRARRTHPLSASGRYHDRHHHRWFAEHGRTRGFTAWSPGSTRAHRAAGQGVVVWVAKRVCCNVSRETLQILGGVTGRACRQERCPPCRREARGDAGYRSPRCAGQPYSGAGRGSAPRRAKPISCSSATGILWPLDVHR